MRKIALILNTMLLSICAFGNFSCLSNDVDKQRERYTEISSYEDLIRIARVWGGKYKLTRDIDCNYNTLTAPLKINTFDGQGHTIKNFIVSANTMFEGNEVSNVTFDNIVLDGQGKSMAIVANKIERMDNVHVKNSSIVCNYSMHGESFVGGLSVLCEEMVNCSITNSTVHANSYAKPAATADAKLYVGGLTAVSENVSNCYVEGCTITAEAKDIYAKPYVGGVSGLAKKDITNTYVKNSTIEGTAGWAMDLVISTKTSPMHIGGMTALAEENTEIKASYVLNSKIEAICCGDLALGGLVAKMLGGNVQQSYSKDIDFSLGTVHVDDTDPEWLVGGFIGSAENAAITSCVAYNGTLNFVNTDSAFKMAGFASKLEKVSLMYCASNNQEGFAMEVSNRDEFCCSDIKNSTVECYITEEKYGNINQLPVLEDSFWTDKMDIKEKLKTTGTNWDSF